MDVDLTAFCYNTENFGKYLMDFLIDLFNLAVLLLAAITFWNFLESIIEVRDLMRQHRERHEVPPEMDPDAVDKREVYVEVLQMESGNTYLAFDSIDHLFLAQGDSAENLAAALKNRFPQDQFKLQEAVIIDQPAT